MKRLDKVCAIWNDLDSAYEKDKARRLSKMQVEITRLEFLGQLTKYTGSMDDITKFKAIFSNEIKTYTDEELERYNKLIDDVQEILAILAYCKPMHGEKKIFEISEDLTIKEIRSIIKEYENEMLQSFSKMNLFGDEDKNADHFSPVNSNTGENTKRLAKEVPPFNVNDYYISKSKVTCTPQDLFNQGRLSNFFESHDGKIQYMCAPTICENYVYIDDKASFLNYLYYVSNNLLSISSFKKAVYMYLLFIYYLVKNEKAEFHFPYVFVSTDLVTETKACYKLGELMLRKNKTKKLNAKGKTFTDLLNHTQVNTEELHKLETTNGGINYQVCLVGDLD